MVPYEAFLSEKPVVTTTDAGGPLEVVADRAHRPRRRAPRRGARRGVRLARATTADDARAWGRAGRELAQRVTWDATHRPAARVRVAYYSPLPPVALGDRRLLGAPAARAVRAGRRRSSPGPAASGGRRRPDVCLYHVGNDPDAHGWIVDALRRRPGVVVLHEFVLHHLVSGLTLARGDVDGYLDALERDAGLVGRLLGVRRRSTARIPPLWETRPQDFPLAARGARPRRRARSSTPATSRSGARGRLRGADLADPDAGLARGRRRAGRGRGQPADRLLRAHEREQADPAALRAHSRGSAAAPRRPAAARRRRLAAPRRAEAARTASCARST